MSGSNSIPDFCPTLRAADLAPLLPQMDKPSGPASLVALRDALLKGREPPPARGVAGLASYRWLVVGTVCIGAFMGQVDSSIAQLVLPRLEVAFDARLST